MTAKPGVCLVTGASYGLGAEISRQLGRAGWTVLLVARSADKLEVLEREICGGEGGGAALGLACDITDTTAVLQLGQKVREKFPEGPDVIINNAAYVPPIHTFATGDVSEWQKAIGVNVMGALLVTRAFLPGMLERKSGKIIFISSKAGVSPSPGLAVHGGTKALVEAVARSVRQEVAASGLTVSLVRPGGVATPGYSHATSNISQQSLDSLGCWVPPDPALCLQPQHIAASIVNIVQTRNSQDIQEINILPPPRN